MAKTFNLVLTGRVAAGHTREAAAAAFAKLMHLPEQRALELLAGKETVIKRNVDDATRARYLGALGPIGVEARAEEILAAPDPVAAAPAPVAAPVPALAAVVKAEYMKCPACGDEQPKRNLCRKCGADIRRLLAATANAASAPPLQVSSKSTVLGELEGFTPRLLNVFSLEGRIGRLRFMAYYSAAFLPLLIAGIVGAVLLGASDRPMGGFAKLLAIVIGLATLWSLVRFTVLRLHDINLSGKWLLLLLPLTPLGTLVLSVWAGSMARNDYGKPPGPNTFWTVVGAVLFILLFILLFVGRVVSGGPPKTGS